MARNLYAGYCYCCGAYVPPGYGHFEKAYDNSTGAKWRIKCVKCASGRTVTDDDPCVKGVKKRLERMKKEAEHAAVY